MTPVERFDACMRQAKFAYDMHNDRRQWEWKITLGLWAVILTTIVKHISVPNWAWIVVVLSYGLLWLAQVWVANENNKRWYDHFLLHASRILQNENHPICNPPGRIRGCGRLGVLKAWAMIFQFLTTVILAVIAFCLGRSH